MKGLGMDGRVSLVIPGRNAAATLRPCLEAATALLGRDGLDEVLFVDDGSTDDSAAVAAAYPVTVVRGEGKGPGSARNLGWRAARNPLVWFMDSDCVAEPEALALLLPHMADPAVAGAGGSYANLWPDALLACLIHEEIIERHRHMPVAVDYLATFNVLYRRAVLEEVGGFDEGNYNGPGSPGAEDIDLAYKIHEAGCRMRFEVRSRVGHFHPTRLGRYLRSQRHHGYYRVALHLAHRAQAAGDSYSGVVDHVQPPLAMLLLASLPLVLWPPLWAVPLGLFVLLFLAQLPMTFRLLRRLRQPRYLAYAPLGMIRAIWRGVGMTQALLDHLNPWRRRAAPASGRSNVPASAS